jgi:hypothetical protein
VAETERRFSDFLTVARAGLLDDLAHIYLREQIFFDVIGLVDDAPFVGMLRCVGKSVAVFNVSPQHDEFSTLFSFCRIFKGQELTYLRNRISLQDDCWSGDRVGREEAGAFLFINQLTIKNVERMHCPPEQDVSSGSAANIFPDRTYIPSNCRFFLRNYLLILTEPCRQNFVAAQTGLNLSDSKQALLFSFFQLEMDGVISTVKKISTNTRRDDQQSGEYSDHQSPKRYRSFILACVWWAFGGMAGICGVLLLIFGYGEGSNSVTVCVGLFLLVVAFISGWHGASVLVPMTSAAPLIHSAPLNGRSENISYNESIIAVMINDDESL